MGSEAKHFGIRVDVARERERLLLSTAAAFEAVLGYDPEVRLATPADVPALRRFLEAVRAEYRIHVPERVERDLDDVQQSYHARGGFLVLAADRAGILGTFALRPVAPAEGIAGKFYLAGALRGLGLGTQLMYLTQRYARALGVTTLRAETNDRAGGRGLLTKTGFRFVGKSAEVGFPSLSPADAYVMAWRSR